MKHLYLFLFTFFSLSSIGQTATVPSAGDGTVTDPYLISSLNELYWVSEQTFSTLDWSDGIYFLQTKDIDASDTANWSTGWIPIGGRDSQTLVSNNKIFKGIYNGNNFSISNLYISGNIIYNGLFGRIDKLGIVINLNISNINLSVGASAGKTGSLVGQNGGEVYNCSSSGTLTSSGSGVGGLVGQNTRNIQNSFSTATVIQTGGGQAGVLVGLNQFFIQNSFANGSVNGTDKTGGLVGSHQTTKRYIEKCYSNSTVANNGINVGGFLGWLEAGYIVDSNNNYWNSSKFVGIEGLGAKNGGKDAIYVASGLTGLTDDQIKNASNFSGWDFEGETTNGKYDLWKIGSDGYPTVYDNGTSGQELLILIGAQLPIGAVEKCPITILFLLET